MGSGRETNGHWRVARERAFRWAPRLATCRRHVISRSFPSGKGRVALNQARKSIVREHDAVGRALINVLPPYWFARPRRALKLAKVDALHR